MHIDANILADTDENVPKPTPTVTILVGDAFEQLRQLPSQSVQCAVTSPPYFGLRSYLHDGHPDKALEIGAEQTPEAYIATLVTVFREMRRVLADDGVFWLNIGDSYASGAKGGGGTGSSGLMRDGRHESGRQSADAANGRAWFSQRKYDLKLCGVKPKDLLMIPARVALALQADGWYLRSHCIWHKPNTMPESVRDRPTSAHESVFLLTKQPKYFYNSDAIREPIAASSASRLAQNIAGQKGSSRANGGAKANGNMKAVGNTDFRNARNVWKIPPRPYKGAHFATFPPELAARCIKAGSRPGDTVIDPFAGAGTTALAARDLKRNSVLIELNPEYAELTRQRLGLL